MPDTPLPAPSGVQISALVRIAALAQRNPQALQLLKKDILVCAASGQRTRVIQVHYTGSRSEGEFTDFDGVTQELESGNSVNFCMKLPDSDHLFTLIPRPSGKTAVAHARNEPERPVEDVLRDVKRLTELDANENREEMEEVRGRLFGPDDAEMKKIGRAKPVIQSVTKFKLDPLMTDYVEKVVEVNDAVEAESERASDVFDLEEFEAVVPDEDPAWEGIADLEPEENDAEEVAEEEAKGAEGVSLKKRPSKRRVSRLKSWASPSLPAASLGRTVSTW